MRWARACGTLAVLATLAGAAAAGWSAAPGAAARATSGAVAAKPATAAGKPAPRRGKAAPVRGAFPPGPGRDIAVRDCAICHSAMLSTQQHKDSTGWEKTVGQMEKWGAPVNPAERESLMTYLRTHLGPSAPAPAK